MAWASMTDRNGRLLSVAQVIDAHLVTHSPAEWMTELRLYQARAESAEYELDQTLSALKVARDFTDAVDALKTPRMPTRDEFQDVKTVLAGVANWGDDDA